MRMRVNDVIISNSVGSSVSSPIMMTTPTVPESRKPPSPGWPTRRSICGASWKHAVDLLVCAAASGVRLGGMGRTGVGRTTCPGVAACACAAVGAKLPAPASTAATAAVRSAFEPRHAVRRRSRP